MRYGIFADIHGNLQAMEAVLAALSREGIHSYFCCGDVVGYGANPHECINLMWDRKITCVAGNHDWAVVDKTDIEYFNPAARLAIEWTKNKVCREDMAFLDRLKLIHKNEDFILVHGTLQEPSYFHYLIDVRQAAGMFFDMDRNLCFVGHSHVPAIFIEKGDEAVEDASLSVKIAPDRKYIVNVGSVGQPRDGNPMAAYCVLDTEKQIVQIRRVHYDIKEAQKRILAVGLTSFLAQRLEQGQ